MPKISVAQGPTDNRLGLAGEVVQDAHGDEVEITEGSVEPDENQENPADETADEPTDSYDDWINDQLRYELEERELSQSGNKAELVARLREDDKAS